jgi:hypothetical protein
MASLYLAAPWVIGMYVMGDSLINLGTEENLKTLAQHAIPSSFPV